MDYRSLTIWSCALLQLLFLAVDGKEPGKPKTGGAKYLCECYLKNLQKLDILWTPGRNFHENTTDGDMRRLYGFSKNLMNARAVGNKDSEPQKILGTSEDKLYPDDFDAREAWPACNSTISSIFDTGFCASHWAVAVIQAIQDRICIHTGGKKKEVRLSVLHPLQCCKTCGSGCKGGYPFQAWDFIEKNGIVTGGDYGSLEGCKPYPIKSPCNYQQYPNNCLQKQSPVFVCPQEPNTCSTNNPDPLTYHVDLVRALPNTDKFTQAWTTEFIKQEIIQNGPVTATMRLYADFFSYKGGIYSPTPNAKKLDDITLKIIGWGKDKKRKNVEYWLGVMPWGQNFGENGFVKIKIGVAALQIDRRMHTGAIQAADLLRKDT